MGTDWKVGFNWASTFNDKLFDIIRKNAGDIIDVRQSTKEEDVSQATDFVISVTVGTIAARVRKISFGKPFTDVTIRSYNNGMRTEIDKIKSGWGKYYVYYWSVCGSWVFYSLDKIRETNMLDEIRSNEIRNHDGTAFIMIDVYDLYLNDCIIGCSEEIEKYIKNRTE